MLRASAVDRGNAKFKLSLPFKPKRPTALDVVKCNNWKKKKKKKKQSCYNAILNVESHCSSMVKTKIVF